VSASSLFVRARAFTEFERLPSITAVQATIRLSAEPRLSHAAICSAVNANDGKAPIKSAPPVNAPNMMDRNVAFTSHSPPG
jgi:hypothetical protein